MGCACSTIDVGRMARRGAAVGPRGDRRSERLKGACRRDAKRGELASHVRITRRSTRSRRTCAGPLRTGTPEELVLNGSFQECFRNDGIEFDSSSGAFRIHRQRSGRVALFGERLTATWTARSLEREGYEVISESDASCCDEPLKVEVLGENGSTHWRATLGRLGSEHQSLGSLLSAVRAAHAEPN